MLMEQERARVKIRPKRTRSMTLPPSIWPPSRATDTANCSKVCSTRSAF